MLHELRTLAIPLGFIALGGLICWVAITAKAKWPVKLSLIIAVPAFGLVVWSSLGSYLGWPAADTPPEKARLAWALVKEPPPGMDESKGDVYLWLLPVSQAEGGSKPGVFDFKARRQEPRAYRIPYTRKLHQALTGAMRMIKQGRRVMFDRSKMGQWPPGKRGRRGRIFNEYDVEGPKFYEMPSVSPFRKDDK